MTKEIDKIGNEQQVKSKERVADHGEVFTSEREVNAMLDLVKQETERIDSRFLEPACGTGNFLVEILRRKLTIVEERYKSCQLEYERNAVTAVSSIYGVELLDDNVIECRSRLFNIFDNHYAALYKDKCKEECRKSIKYIINGFIESELEIFKTRFEEERVPGIQDDRSLSIAWLCYYFKDAITSSNALAITDYVDKVHKRDDYKVHGWYRISALQAAAFILTSNTCFANNLLQHIGCGQGWARGFIVQSASIISPLLSFNNLYLRRAVELNLKYGQIFEKESVVLYLTTHGDSIEKRNWLEQQIKISDKDRHIEFLSKLKNTNRYYESGFFVKAFSSAKSYFIFKLLSEPVFSKVEPELFDGVLLNYEELNNKEESHPLNSQYIDLSFLKEK